MRGGHAPIQIQRWAPYDYVNDPFVKRLYFERDYRTAAFYPMVLFQSFLEGGDLPSDPRELAAVMLMPTRDVEHSLKVCLDAGKLFIKEGRLFHKRVMAEVIEELEYRANQVEVGRKGGRPKRKGYPKGSVSENLTPPSPLPLPPPLPPPPPLPEARASRPPNPLAPDFAVLVAECLSLVSEVAALRDMDPTEIMAEVGTWKGSRAMNPAAMTPERLLNVVVDLRRMRDGQARASPSQKARSKDETDVAAIRAGSDVLRRLNESRGVRAGDGRAELPRGGEQRGDGRAEGDPVPDVGGGIVRAE